MAKPAKKGPAGDVEQIRSGLLRRYEKAFGCAWPLAPWGRAWADILEEAHSADTAYVGGVALLKNLAKAIDNISAYTESCGLAIGEPRTEEMLSNRTRPEQFVFLLASDDDNSKALRQVRTELAEILMLLEAQPEKLFAIGSEAERQSARAAFKGAEDAQRATELAGPDWAAIDHERSLFATHASRRLRPMTRRQPHGPTIQVGHFASVLAQGPPPLTEAEPLNSPKWRRAYLVQLLDMYPHRFIDDLKAVLPPTDAEIALVTLLAGGLEEVNKHHASRIDDGEAAVLTAERKAIAQTRRRRTFVSRRLGELGMGSPHEAARAAAAARRKETNAATDGGGGERASATPAAKDRRRNRSR